MKSVMFSVYLPGRPQRPVIFGEGSYLSPEDIEEFEKFYRPINKTFDAVERWKFEQLKNISLKFPVYTGPSEDIQSVILKYQTGSQDEGVILTLYTAASPTTPTEELTSSDVAETSGKPDESTSQNGTVPPVSEGKSNGWIWLVLVSIALIIVILLIRKR